MRVLHVISSLDRKSGGPTSALIGLASAQQAAGLEVEVLATFRAGEDVAIAETLRRRGVTVTTIGPTVGRLCGHPELAAAVEKTVASADVVHLHAMWEEVQYLASATATRAGKPYVLRPCGMLSRWSLRSSSRLVKRLYLLWRGFAMLRGATLVHCTSEQEADEVRALTKHARTCVVRNGVDAAWAVSLPDAGTFRRNRLDGFGGTLVVALGRIAAKKNLGFLVEAFGRAALTEARLLIVGPGDPALRAALARQAGSQGGRVVILDAVDGAEKQALLHDADVFALPSLDENFANALLEAAACGVPCLASPHVGVAAEVERLGGAKTLPLDLDAWSSALRHVAAAGRLDDATRRAITASFDWDGVAREWRDRYQSLVGAA